MTYNDFSDTLKQIKKDFEISKGTKLTTIDQLENYLVERKSKKMSKGLKSLKGLSL